MDEDTPKKSASAHHHPYFHRTNNRPSLPSDTKKLNPDTLSHDTWEGHRFISYRGQRRRPSCQNTRGHGNKHRSREHQKAFQPSLPRFLSHSPPPLTCSRSSNQAKLTKSLGRPCATVPDLAKCESSHIRACSEEKENDCGAPTQTCERVKVTSQQQKRAFGSTGYPVPHSPTLIETKTPTLHVSLRHFKRSSQKHTLPQNTHAEHC